MSATTLHRDLWGARLGLESLAGGVGSDPLFPSFRASAACSAASACLLALSHLSIWMCPAPHCGHLVQPKRLEVGQLHSQVSLSIFTSSRNLAGPLSITNLS